MAVNRAAHWSRTNLPKIAYVAMTLAGMVFIWFAKTNDWSAQFTLGIPVALIVGYFLIAAMLAGFRFHDEQAGDNLYYMGFLFTLTSLGVSLYRYDVGASIDGIVRDFGLAVVTTICGIGLRILYNQVRRDPIDIERTARHELAEMARRVRFELEAASREFSDFRRVSNQMMEEGFEEISRQAEKSGQQIFKIMEALSQEAVKPVTTAGGQLRGVLEDVSKETEARLNNSVELMKVSSKGFEDANAQLVKAVRAFADHVDTAGAKLADIKTPDEIISIKLTPSLKAIQKTHQIIEKLASSVEQSVAAMDKAVEATNQSQRATENLTKLIRAAKYRSA